MHNAPFLSTVFALLSRCATIQYVKNPYFKPVLERAAYLRNFVFGVEDSLVSTVGLLSGVALSGVSKSTIFLTGVILIVVEAFSMAVGSFLSESSAAEYLDKGAKLSRATIIDSLIMFVSYLFAGLVPLLPYAFFSLTVALRLSIVLALFALFILGWFGAWLASRRSWRQAWRMTLLGGLAILVGILAGRLGQVFGL